MVKIRLSKVGRKNDPFYRIVAIDESKKNIGKPLSVLGYWYPKKDNKKINKKEIGEWVKNGAQVSDAVKKLLA